MWGFVLGLGCETKARGIGSAGLEGEFIAINSGESELHYEYRMS